MVDFRRPGPTPASEDPPRQPTPASQISPVKDMGTTHAPPGKDMGSLQDPPGEKDIAPTPTSLLHKKQKPKRKRVDSLFDNLHDDVKERKAN